MSTREPSKGVAEVASALGRIGFRDRRAAAENLERLAGKLGREAMAALPTILGESPDPDSGLNLLERLGESASPEIFRLFERHPFLLHYALVVFGYSQFLGETLIQNTDLLHGLARDKGLEHSRSREEFREGFARFRSRSFDTDIALLLSRFKRREYVRIMLRDVLRIATLAETTGEISALSDVLIEEALRDADGALRNRYGAPRHTDAQGRVMDTAFAVLALGKLGGNELNYASDVDLLYLYGDGEPQEGEGEALSNREYFIRLGQQVTEILSRPTREGQVFRIDLRLRPLGREGEPAVALGHALRYYSEHAHDWELQALIKARHSAGDLGLAREFIRGVQPYVYRPELNLAAIETAMASLEKIGTRRRTLARRREPALDVKLDRGGIRDIEFLVQCLQRVHGGAEAWLRSGGTLSSLSKLHDKGHLGGKDFDELSNGYELLRTVEHRLQLRRGQQTHSLPDGEAEMGVLYRSAMDDPSGEYRPESLVSELRKRMTAITRIYGRILHSQQRKGEERGDEFKLRPGAAEVGREKSYGEILQRLAVDSPALHELAARREVGTHTRRNLHRFLSAAFTSPERYAAVLRDAEAVEKALRIFSVSEFLTDILIRHPEEIASIAEIQGVGARGAGALFGGEVRSRAAEDPVLAYVGSDSVAAGEKLALLRQHSRHRVFLTGARDVMQPRPVYESIAELTATADDAIAAALDIAEAPAGFAALALGRLGSSEFDIGSDADLLFVREEAVDPREASRTAEQVVQALAAYTRDGIVFAVDPRLRPRGYEGELVITPEQLGEYFAEAAQPWEALTYSKLRYVAGSERLAEQAIREVERKLPRFRGEGFRPAVREMRTKLEKAEGGGPNFKTAPGAFYDIDFIVCTLLVEHGVETTRGSIRERLHSLGERGLLSDDACATLDFAAELLRTVEHVVRLVQGRARKTLPASEHARQTVESLTGRILEREMVGGLGRELERTFASVRDVYERALR